MIELRAMDEDAYQEYLRSATREYAQDKVLAGSWPEDKALAMAEDSFRLLLPDGVGTANHFLFTVHEPQSDSQIGIVWYALDERGPELAIFIYDFQITERYRRQGYGKQVMAALERQAAGLGARRIILHVFGHNEGARRFYGALGFRVDDLIMSKAIGG